MSEEQNNLPDTFDIHYVESKYLRTVHSDGALGNFSPQGKFMLVFYSEHPPFPSTVTHKINNDGDIGEVVEQKGRFGIIREKEVVVEMDSEQAAILSEWLTAHVKERHVAEQELISAKSSANTEQK